MRRFAAALPALLLLGFVAGAVLADEEGVEERPLTVEDVKQEMDALKKRVAELEAKEAEDATATESLFETVVERIRCFGSIRARFEWAGNLDFDEQSGDWAILRTQLGFDVDVAEFLTARVKIQDSRAFGGAGSVVGDLGGVDLREGHFTILDLPAPGFDLKIGRSQMKYGDQRLISDLDWHPVGRSWDGVWLKYHDGTVRSDVFVTRIDDDFLLPTFAPAGDYTPQDFCGWYASVDLTEDHVGDVYVLYRRNKDRSTIVNEAGIPGTESLWTVGGRAKGEASGIDYVAEAAFQFGDHAGDDIWAQMVEVGLGYTIDAGASPHVDVTFIWATGDPDPTDGERNTFDPLYTFGHSYLGLMDRVGRRNTVSPRARGSLDLCEGWTLFLDWHFFWLETNKDDLYHAGGGVLRQTVPGANGYVGHEVDLHTKAEVLERLAIWAGYSHFFPGPFLRDTGVARSSEWLFVQLTVSF